MSRASRFVVNTLTVLLFLTYLPGTALGQVVTKAHVGDLIQEVEKGTDEFKKYLERKGENAREGISRTRGRRRAGGGTPSEAQKERITQEADDVWDAVKDLEKATDRLKRRFRRVDNYLDTRLQVEKVVDEGRRVNKLVVGGRYSSQAAKAWAALRVRINDLARVFRIKPLAI